MLLDQAASARNQACRNLKKAIWSAREGHWRDACLKFDKDTPVGEVWKWFRRLVGGLLLVVPNRHW